MGSNRARTWIVATVLLVVLVLVGGWFLAVSPIYAETGEIRDQTAAVEAENEVLRERNTELRRQFGELDQMKAELAEYQKGIPISPELTDFQREIEAVADDVDVTITDIQVSQAQVADTTVTMPPTEEAEDPAADEEVGAEENAEGAEGAEGDSTEEPQTDTDDDGGDGTPLLEGLYTIQVTVSVFGSYPNARDFVEEMQTGIDRTYYVPSLAISASEPGEGGSGLPAAVAGDVTLTLSGLVFVLPADSAVETEEEPTEEVLPEGTGRNWFVPIEGESVPEASTQPEED